MTPMNVVLIITDDMRWDMLQEGLPSTKGWTRLSQGFNANPVCCASRCSILTGNYSQTTGVWGNNPPIGGYSKFDAHHTIATELNAAGYHTSLTGKYLNGYDDINAGEVPPGWNEWWAITSRGDQYYGYGVSVEGSLVTYGRRPHEYLTDVIASEAEHICATAPEPFFAMVTPTAPHKQAVAAPRHTDTHRTLGKWDIESVNEADVSDKPAWVRKIEPLSPARLNAQKSFRRNQYQTLDAVDDLIERVMTTLRNRGIIGNTVIIFCSDNGYMWGEHRLVAKGYPYLEATRMAIAVRWPNEDIVARGFHPTTGALVQNIDIAPTIAEIAGIDFACDGGSMVPLLMGNPPHTELFIEHGTAAEDPYGAAEPAFVQCQRKSWTYTWYGTGEEEFYDLLSDPLQLRNIAAKPKTFRDELEFARKAVHDHIETLPPGMASRP